MSQSDIVLMILTICSSQVLLMISSKVALINLGLSLLDFLRAVIMLEKVKLLKKEMLLIILLSIRQKRSVSTF